MAPKASLSAKTAQFERFFKVPVHNGLRNKKLTCKLNPVLNRLAKAIAGGSDLEQLPPAEAHAKGAADVNTAPPPSSGEGDGFRRHQVQIARPREH